MSLGSRERFERAAVTEGLDIEKFPDGKRYWNKETELAWSFWKAALTQPIEVPPRPLTLPTGDVLGVERCRGEFAMRKRVVEALRAQGYEVKS